VNLSDPEPDAVRWKRIRDSLSSGTVPEDLLIQAMEAQSVPRGRHLQPDTTPLPDLNGTSAEDLAGTGGLPRPAPISRDIALLTVKEAKKLVEAAVTEQARQSTCAAMGKRYTKIYASPAERELDERLRDEVRRIVRDG
jgi:hypothetical protein